MEIVDLPESTEFKEYCISYLGFSPQTDFNKLKGFLKYVLSRFEISEHRFIELQYNEMSDILKNNGIDISPSTISDYCKKLENIGWIDESSILEYIYYVYDT